MTENFQDKLHQEECNNQKVQKFVPVLEENLSVKNAPKLSAKYLQDKTCKTKQMQNIPLTLEDIFKSTKSVLAPRRTPPTLPHLKFSAKFVTERTFIVTIANFSIAKSSLEVHGV